MNKQIDGAIPDIELSVVMLLVTFLSIVKKHNISERMQCCQYCHQLIETGSRQQLLYHRGKFHTSSFDKQIANFCRHLITWVGKSKGGDGGMYLL